MNVTQRTTRLLFDLEAYISGETRAMKSRSKVTELLTLIARSVESENSVDSRAMKYLVQSIRRFLSDENHNLDKALGLKKLKAGNPGGIPKKRRLTPDAKIEMLQEYDLVLAKEQLRAKKKSKSIKGAHSPSENALVMVSKKFQCSRPTLRNAIAERKK